MTACRGTTHGWGWSWLLPRRFWGAAYQEGGAKWAVCLTQPSVCLLPCSSWVFIFQGGDWPRESVRFRTLLHSGASWLLTNGISNPMETPRGGLKLVLTDWRGPEVYCFPVGPPSSSAGHNPYGIRGPSCQRLQVVLQDLCVNCLGWREKQKLNSSAKQTEGMH